MSKGKDDSVNYSANDKLVSILKEKEFNFISGANLTPQLKRVFFSKEFSNEIINNDNVNLINNNQNSNLKNEEEFGTLIKNKKGESKIPFELSTHMRSNLENSSSLTYSNLKHEKIEISINFSNSASRPNSLLSLENTFNNKYKDNFNEFLDNSCKKNLNLNYNFAHNSNNQESAKNISDNNFSVNEFIERNKNMKFENNNDSSISKDKLVLNPKLRENLNLIVKDLLLSSNVTNFRNDKNSLNLKKINTEINLDNNSSIISNANTNSNFSGLSNLSFVKNKEININSSQITSPKDYDDKRVLCNKKKFSSFIFDEFADSSSIGINTLSDSFHILNKDVNNCLNKNNLISSNKAIDNIPAYNKNHKNNIEDFNFNNNNINAKFKNEILEDLKYSNRKNDSCFKKIKNSAGEVKSDLNNYETSLNPATANPSLSLNLNSDMNLNKKPNFDLNTYTIGNHKNFIFKQKIINDQIF